LSCSKGKKSTRVRSIFFPNAKCKIFLSFTNLLNKKILYKITSVCIDSNLMQWVANLLTNKLKSNLIPSKAIATASFTNWIENWLRNRNFNLMFSRGSAPNMHGLFILHRVNSYMYIVLWRQMFWLREMKFRNAVNFFFCSIKFAGINVFLSIHVIVHVFTMIFCI
jgi:hypothetical protein